MYNGYIQSKHQNVNLNRTSHMIALLEYLVEKCVRVLLECFGML